MLSYRDGCEVQLGQTVCHPHLLLSATGFDSPGSFTCETEFSADSLFVGCRVTWKCIDCHFVQPNAVITVQAQPKNSYSVGFVWTFASTAYDGQPSKVGGDIDS